MLSFVSFLHQGLYSAQQLTLLLFHDILYGQTPCAGYPKQANLDMRVFNNVDVTRKIYEIPENRTHSLSFVQIHQL